MNFLDDDSMAFDRSSVVMQSDRISAKVRVVIEAKLFSYDASWIESNEKLISKFAHDSIFHWFVDVIRNVIVFFVDS